MTNDLISVIIPVYNTEKYLNKCVETVTQQTINNIEILLIDDGSTDNSGKLCDEWANRDSRIRVFHKPNEGLSATRNYGLKHAKGNYVAWVDSDDYVAPFFVEKLYNKLIDNDADMSMCNFYGLQGDILTFDGASRIFDATYTSKQFMEMVYTTGFFCVIWNKMAKKEAFYNVLFPVGRRFEDASVMRRLAENCNKIVVFDEPLYYYRRHEASITMKKRSKQEEDQYLMEYCKWVEDDIEIYKENFDEKLCAKASKCICNAIIMHYRNLERAAKKKYKKKYDSYVKSILKNDESFKAKVKYMWAYVNIDFYIWMRKVIQIMAHKK